MIRRGAMIPVVATLIITLCSSSGFAQYTTPGGSSAILFQPCAFELSDVADGPIAGFIWNRYSWTNIKDEYFDNFAVCLVPDFDTALRGQLPWLFVNTHGGIVFEAYPATTQGLAARDAAYNSYVPDLYGSTVVVRQTMFEADGVTPRMYVILCVEGFVRTLYQGSRINSINRSVVHFAGCDAWNFRSAFRSPNSNKPAADFLAYDYPVTNIEVESDGNTIYYRLSGGEGVAKRPLHEAIQGLMIKIDPVTPSLPSAPDIVISPRIKLTSLTQGAHFSSPTPLQFDFDAPMKTTVALSDIVRCEGNVRFGSGSLGWVNSTQLQGTIRGIAKGSGTVVLMSYDPDAFDLTGLMSDTGIGLDGNTDPAGNATGGEFPAGDDHRLSLVSDNADNPAASVTAFTAMREADGVHVRWSVELENNTQLYRVEHSSGWHGPWTVVSVVTATGAHQYESVDPDGPEGSVYRLVEVETGGRELVHAQEVAVPPFSIPPDPVVTEALADSLNAALLQQYPTPMNQPDDINPIFGWVAVIPDETYRSAIQSLVNYRQSRGLVAQAMTVAEINGWGGIGPFVAWGVPYGLRYLLVCGDANNAAVHDDPSSWVNGWTYPGYSSQPQYDVVPMDNFRDPWDAQSQSLTWFTRHYGTDALKADVDGDSIPDMAMGRLPCRTPAELSVMAAKTIAGEQQAPIDAIGVWGEFRDLSGLDGEYGRALCDSIVNTQLAGRTVYQLYNTNANPIPYATREQLAISAMNAGRVIIMTFGSQSNRAKWAIWYDKTQGFVWTKVSNSYSSFLLAASCDIIDVDRSEDPAFGRPLIELAMLELNKGPFMAAGFTRGTFQYWNFLAAAEFLRIIYGPGASSAGEAWMIAIQNVYREHPECKPQLMAALFLGDPAAIIPGMVATNTTGVGEQTRPLSVQLAPPYPNPSSGATHFRFALPQAAEVALSVHDVQGRVVWMLPSDHYPAGFHVVAWDGRVGTGRLAAPGMYLVRLTTGSRVLTQKMIRLR